MAKREVSVRSWLQCYIENLTMSIAKFKRHHEACLQRITYVLPHFDHGHVVVYVVPEHTARG